MRVFLSYRRGDAGGYAGRLADVLIARLGAKSVFQDVIAIAPGRDFVAAIDRGLDDCDAVLAVIGPGWLTASTPAGAPRLRQADDVVRLELSRALERDVRVVPVLVGGAGLPQPGDLPENLQGLVQRQAVTLHDETWHEDVDGLLRSLRDESPVVAGGRRRFSPAVAAGAAVLVGAAGVLWWATIRDRDPGDGGDLGSDPEGLELGSEGGYPGCPSPHGEGWHSIELDDEPTGVVPIDEPDARGDLRFTVTEANWRDAGSGRWEVILDTEMENAADNELQHGSWFYDYVIVGQRDFEGTCMSADPVFVRPGRVGVGRVGFEVRCEPAGHMQLEVGEGATMIDLTPPGEPVEC